MQEPDATRVRPELRVRVPQHVVYRDFPTQTVVLTSRLGGIMALTERLALCSHRSHAAAR